MTRPAFTLSSAFRGALLLAVLALDQATKYWARVRFSLPDGQPDYMRSIGILGDWLRFRLVYNTGAAFGMRPQNFLPFLQPTWFYALFSLAAIVFLSAYYRRLGPKEWGARLGVVLILAGAVGNLVDRLRFHKVTDFIDTGIPGFFPRWPTFNIADSSVCIGMALLLLLPLWARHTAPHPTRQSGLGPAGEKNQGVATGSGDGS